MVRRQAAAVSLPLASMPSLVRRDSVLVIGPALSGTTSVADVLRRRFPGRRFVEELPPGECPTAVVFVVSATGPMVESDCRLLDSVAAATDLVIGVVSKIDVHRCWRDVLETNRDSLLPHLGCRRRMRWVGVSAAPDIGAPDVEALTEMVRAGLADGGLARRNELRAAESWLMRLERERQVAMTALVSERDTALRARRLVRAEQSIVVRTEVNRSRLHLLDFVRQRCSSVRSTLRSTLAATRRRDLVAFTRWAVATLADLGDEVGREADRHLGVSGLGVTGPGVTGLGVTGVETTNPLAQSSMGVLPVADVPPPPRPSRQEVMLAVLLGGGFGVGLALTVWRVLVGLAPGWSAECGFACAAMGLTLAMWTVHARQSVIDRGVVDRWVGESTDRARVTLEGWVGRRMLEADAKWSAEAAERDAREALRFSRQLAALDRAIRGHPGIPAIRQSLVAVRTELADLRGSSPVSGSGPRLIGNNPD